MAADSLLLSLASKDRRRSQGAISKSGVRFAGQTPLFAIVRSSMEKSASSFCQTAHTLADHAQRRCLQSFVCMTYLS
jgi:hypothetical protein